MDPSPLVQFIGTLGVGGAIAAIMIYVHNNREKEWQAQSAANAKAWEGQAKLLLDVVVANTASNIAVVKTVEANTAMLELVLRGELPGGSFGDNQGRRQRLRRSDDTLSTGG